MRIFIILLVSLCSFYVSAGKYPVVTSIKTTIISAGEERYDITQELIDIGSAADAVVPSGFYVGLAHKHYDDRNQGWPTVIYANSITYDSDGVRTIGDLATQLYNEKGKNENSITHYGENMGSLECVAYVGAPGRNHPWDASNTMIPGGCVSTPPADEWCKITTPELLLDHGTVTLKNTQGNSASASMGVNCTTPMAVTFQLAGGQPYIYLSPGGTADIQVDGKPLDSKIDMPAGQTTLTVKDMLSGVSTEGVTSGSSVLIMSPY